MTRLARSSHYFPQTSKRREKEGGRNGEREGGRGDMEGGRRIEGVREEV